MAEQGFSTGRRSSNFLAPEAIISTLLIVAIDVAAVDLSSCLRLQKVSKLCRLMQKVLLTTTLVARIVHFLRLHLVGRKIASASAIDDSNVFGKVGTTGAEVEAALNGKQVEINDFNDPVARH